MIVGLSVLAARRRISYETWHAIHLLTYLAIALSFLHELAGPNLAGHPAVQILWTLMHGYASRSSCATGSSHRWRTPGATACASKP